MLRDATEEELTAWRGPMELHVAGLQSELDELGATLADERWGNADYIERMVTLEMFCRYQLQDKHRADALLDALHEHGVLVTRYDLGNWLFARRLT